MARPRKSGANAHAERLIVTIRIALPAIKLPTPAQPASRIGDVDPGIFMPEILALTAPDKPCIASRPHRYCAQAAASIGCTDTTYSPAATAHPPTTPAPAP